MDIYDPLLPQFGIKRLTNLKKPTLAEFDLTERDLGQVPQLLAARIYRVAVSRIGVWTAAIIGALSVWGSMKKPDRFSAAHSLAF